GPALEGDLLDGAFVQDGAAAYPGAERRALGLREEPGRQEHAAAHPDGALLAFAQRGRSGRRVGIVDVSRIRQPEIEPLVLPSEDFRRRDRHESLLSI